MLLLSLSAAFASSPAYYGDPFPGAMQLEASLEIPFSFGRPSMGLGLGFAVRYLGTNDYIGPGVDAFVELRWARFSYLAFTAGGRVGLQIASDWSDLVFQPGFGNYFELGRTWRTQGGPGLRIGGRTEIFYGAISYNQLILRDPPISGAESWTPGQPLPLPRWGASTENDRTLQVSVQVPLLPIVYNYENYYYYDDYYYGYYYE